MRDVCVERIHVRVRGLGQMPLGAREGAAVRDATVGRLSRSERLRRYLYTPHGACPAGTAHTTLERCCVL